MNTKQFVEGLNSEQRKRFATSAKEGKLAEFARQEKLSLPDELLDGIAGGVSEGEAPSTAVGVCPQCGAPLDNEIVLDLGDDNYFCVECGILF